MGQVSFKAQMLLAREEAIVAAVNRLLAEKGFDAMTVDAVAAEVGIAKASLYKHFRSKEELAAAAMIRVLDRALAQIDLLSADAGADAVEQLRAVTRWTMQLQLAGEMPSLPAQNSALRTALTSNKVYVDRLMLISERLGAWIGAAQRSGRLDAGLPPEVILYTIFARACDPVLNVLKASANFSDEQIVEILLSTCFDGLRGSAAAIPVPAAEALS
ncbi:MAG: helix-turn-helix transcriptional regulator [Rhizobacter sp.]|nr:helix-turn-helix transcriptional regulator [Rhizobacter sp.]